MWKVFMLLAFTTRFFSLQAQPVDFSNYPVYQGKDLGLTYTPAKSVFRIWAPGALAVSLLLYKTGSEVETPEEIKMKASVNGTWLLEIKKNLQGAFYTFRVDHGAKSGADFQAGVPDPYAKATGVNGKRAAVVNLTSTNPSGWEKDKSPAFNSKTAAIIYELHVRDASISPNSGIKQKGKYAGLTEKGTKNSAGHSTGLDHIRELGVTHVHLLPVYDINSVDESKPGKAQYNWGYDPLNYNVPEGSYSSNAEDPATRIRELKQLVKTFHENGLRVVMDVVYNHTALTERSNFNQIVPGYYYRQTPDGKFSNATACGNETASERPMMRKFIIESMKYWVKEYHIDGFRIDLMGVHDIETMNLLSKELHQIKPDILLYGEGWTAGASPLPESKRALKKYAYQLDRIAVFSDDLRDGLKGSVFVHDEKGFVTGKPGMEESVKFGIVASCKHPQVDYKKVNYSKAPYAAQPHHTVSYVECHDNHTLRDKLLLSTKGMTDGELVNMHKLALSVVLTSQGISFLHAGTEFLRDKKGVENSFESPDSINQVDWDLKTENIEVYNYIKALISLRKKHPAFRMTTAAQVAKHIKFLDMPAGSIGYTIDGAAMKDSWKKILVIFNAKEEQQKIKLPPGEWKVAIADNYFMEGSIKNEVMISGLLDPKDYRCYILYQD